METYGININQLNIERAPVHKWTVPKESRLLDVLVVDDSRVILLDQNKVRSSGPKVVSVWAFPIRPNGTPLLKEDITTVVIFSVRAGIDPVMFDIDTADYISTLNVGGVFVSFFAREIGQEEDDTRPTESGN